MCAIIRVHCDCAGATWRQRMPHRTCVVRRAGSLDWPARTEINTAMTVPDTFSRARGLTASSEVPAGQQASTAPVGSHFSPRPSPRPPPSRPPNGCPARAASAYPPMPPPTRAPFTYVREGGGGGCGPDSFFQQQRHAPPRPSPLRHTSSAPRPRAHPHSHSAYPAPPPSPFSIHRLPSPPTVPAPLPSLPCAPPSPSPWAARGTGVP